MPQILSVEPEIAQIGSQMVELALGGVQSAASALTTITGLLPAGADEVSARAASAFAAEGSHMAALSNMAQEELGRAGRALITIAQMYSDVDESAGGKLADS